MKKFVYLLIPLVVFVLYTGGYNHLNYEGFKAAFESIQANDTINKAVDEYQFLEAVQGAYDADKYQYFYWEQSNEWSPTSPYRYYNILYLINQDADGNFYESDRQVIYTVETETESALYDFPYAKVDFSHYGDEADLVERIASGIRTAYAYTYVGITMAISYIITPFEAGIDIIKALLYLLGITATV